MPVASADGVPSSALFRVAMTPHGVLGARGQTGDGVAGAGRRRLPVRRVVPLRPRLPLHLVAVRVRGRVPGHRELFAAGRHRDPRHPARRRCLRRARGVRRGRSVVGVLPGGDDPHGVLGACGQSGDGVAGTGRRCLPGRRIVALLSRLPLHLVAARVRGRVPGHRKPFDAGRHRDPRHLARRRRLRRSGDVCRRRAVPSLLPGGVDPHRVLGARRQVRDDDDSRASRGDLAALGVAVALRPGLPLHHVAVRVGRRRPLHLKLIDLLCQHDIRHLSGRVEPGCGRRPRHLGGG